MANAECRISCLLFVFIFLFGFGFAFIRISITREENFDLKELRAERVEKICRLETRNSKLEDGE